MERRMWHIWPGQWWPSLPEQEQVFYKELKSEVDTINEDKIISKDELTTLGKSKTSKKTSNIVNHIEDILEQEQIAQSVIPEAGFDRDDVIALMNALHCGTNFQSFKDVAPGADFERILKAYDWIEEARVKSVMSWYEIEEDPTAHTIQRNATNAAKLLPSPVHKILSVLEFSVKSDITEVVADVSASVQKMHVIARGFEKELEGLPAQDPKGIELGTKLHIPTSSSVYSNQYFLPDRLAALSALKLSALLGQ